jgi:hypothetical protein
MMLMEYVQQVGAAELQMRRGWHARGRLFHPTFS